MEFQCYTYTLRVPLSHVLLLTDHVTEANQISVILVSPLNKMHQHDWAIMSICCMMTNDGSRR